MTSPSIPAADVAQRLIEQSDPVDSGCRRWRGWRNAKGYGQIKVEGSVRSVHRLAYELWVGPIPEGYDIDHVYAKGCRYRDCIEPGHLEAISHRENLLRTPKPKYCPKGHEFTPENTMLRRKNDRPGVSRVCRECRRQLNRKYKARKRLQRNEK